MKNKANRGPRDEIRSPEEMAERPAQRSAAVVEQAVGHLPARPAPDTPGESDSERVTDEARPTLRWIRPGRQRVVRPRKDKTRKAHSLIDKIYDPPNLYRAWRRVRRNRGAHGLDKMSVHMFEANWEVHLTEIHRHLTERRYQVQPIRRVYIPKSSDPSKLRPLGIPVVKDRIVQQAIVQITDPTFDDEMSERSFGFRKGRSAHDAIATVKSDAAEGYRYVLDADIASFFDKIDHDVVMTRVRARIADGRVLDLIKAFLKAGVSEDGQIRVPSAGVPQGGVISPWLSNLVLDDLDKALESEGYRHVRYADDFVVLCKSREDARHALVFVKEVLGKLKLSLHETKTRLSSFLEGFEFLGFRFRCHWVGISGRNLEKFKDRLRYVTRRQQGRNVDAVLQDLNPILRGWAGYFGVVDVAKLFWRLDQWIRMRMRAFKRKRKCRNDNHRIPNKRLKRWGLLSLAEYRLSLRHLTPDGRWIHESGSRLLDTRHPRGVAQSR